MFIGDHMLVIFNRFFNMVKYYRPHAYYRPKNTCANSCAHAVVCVSAPKYLLGRNTHEVCTYYFGVITKKTKYVCKSLYCMKKITFKARQKMSSYR